MILTRALQLANKMLLFKFRVSKYQIKVQRDADSVWLIWEQK